MILDANADKEKVRNLLSRLLSQMEDLQKKAFTYKAYQKNFKVRSSVIILCLQSCNVAPSIIHNSVVLDVVYIYIHAYIHLGFKHAVLGTLFSHLGCYLLVVNERDPLLDGASTEIQTQYLPAH